MSGHTDVLRLAIRTLISLLNSLTRLGIKRGCASSCIPEMAKYLGSDSHQSLKHVGTCCTLRMRRAGHALGQVTRAVERVRVGPLLERLLPIKKDQLQGHRRFLGGHQTRPQMIFLL